MKNIKYKFIFYLAILFLFIFLNLNLYSYEQFLNTIISNYDLILNFFKFKVNVLIINDSETIYEILSIKNNIKEIKKKIKGDLLTFLYFDSIGCDLNVYDIEKEKKIFTKKIPLEFFPYLDNYIIDFIYDINFVFKYYYNNNFNFSYLLGINNFEIKYNNKIFLSFFKSKKESDSEILVRYFLLNIILKKGLSKKYFEENEFNKIYPTIKYLAQILSNNINNYIENSVYSENYKIFELNTDDNIIFLTKEFLQKKIIELLKDKKLNYLEYKIINYIIQ